MAVVSKPTSENAKPNPETAEYKLKMYFHVPVLLRNGQTTGSLTFYSYDHKTDLESGLRKLRKLAKSFDDSTMLKWAGIYDNRKEGKPLLDCWKGSYTSFDSSAFFNMISDGEVIDVDSGEMEAPTEVQKPVAQSKPEAAAEAIEQPEPETITEETELVFEEKEQPAQTPTLPKKVVVADESKTESILNRVQVREQKPKYPFLTRKDEIIDFAKELLKSGEITGEQKNIIWQEMLAVKKAMNTVQRRDFEQDEQYVLARKLLIRCTTCYPNERGSGEMVESELVAA